MLSTIDTRLATTKRHITVILIYLHDRRGVHQHRARSVHIRSCVGHDRTHNGDAASAAVLEALL